MDCIILTGDIRRTAMDGLVDQGSLPRTNRKRRHPQRPK